MKVALVSYLDPRIYGGGGELSHCTLIDHGRRRGHVISVHGYLKHRPQRVMRRSGLHRRFSVPMDADAYVLPNLRNAPRFPRRILGAGVDGILATGRAAVFQNAWVDVCEYELPGGGGAIGSRLARDLLRFTPRTTFRAGLEPTVDSCRNS